MTGGQWEVVGGGKTKKTKSKGNKTSPKEKSNEGPILSAPIKESQTIYTAFLEKEKKESDPKTKLNGNEKPSKIPEKVTQKKKKAGEKKAVPSAKLTLEQAFTNVTEEDLKNHLATLEVLCPNSPFHWLKDLASFLNVKLDIPVDDLMFSSKPVGYPSLLLNKAVHKRIVGLLNRCTPQMLQLFYEFCLQNLVQDTLKGLHTLGYRVMLQLVAQLMPSVAHLNIPKCSELCTSHQNRQNICISVLWAAGQAGNNNLEAGMQVWLELMFPLIGAKNCTAFVVDYLEKLISMEEVKKCNKSLIDIRNLFPILDFIYSKDLAKSVQKKLIAIYPTLKKLSYGPEPETTLRNYFPSYLRRLEPQCSPLLKEEILNSLLLCLEKDNRCYSIWRQLYTKHFIQSKLLISHLNDHWSSVPPSFPKRNLRDTLSTFQVTNEELLASGRRNMQDVEECRLVNKELLSKLNTGSFSWPLFTFVLFSFATTLLYYDILKHGSFPESVTGKFMKNYGLLVYCAQAGEKLTYFYGRARKLCDQYIPYAVEWLNSTVQPTVELGFQKIFYGAGVAWEATGGIREWIGEVLPPVLTSAEKLAATYLTMLQSVLRDVLGIVMKQILAAMAYIVQSADLLAAWIQANPQIMEALGTIKQLSMSLMENVQRNALYVFQQVKEYIPLPS